ncbi:cytidine deaminase [Salibacterium salarium]|uniref:Cytidine deaminase n=1 Tax=Salibacterium salarium TaxID=284579 RepID=A0A3R9P1M6_9BACI|nr:cytidine deaminase [Salibacterium salarium]RSL30895.1 cytidine deaminase [Salibacterium salarium]
MVTDEELLEKAKDARTSAYVPYSRFPVGAALLTDNGEVYTGSNIENASYGLTNCAERTAVFKAVSEGKKNVTSIAVVADTDEPVSPCGACRQVLSEFLPSDGKVILGNLHGMASETTIAELLPGAFQAKDLNNE